MTGIETLSLLHDRLVSEYELEDKIGWARGTAAVKRCRQTMPIPYVQIGRQIKYRLSEIDSFLNANTVTPKTPTR